MSANSKQFADFIFEKLESLEGFSHGRLFGGIGLKAGAVQFGMIMDNAVYFVVDAKTRKKYQEAGSACFAYDTRKRRVFIQKYYEVPPSVIEHSGEFLQWANEAIQAAKHLKKA
jgi:TfoX/Sxy family transcriptional regulator of competence genes